MVGLPSTKCWAMALVKRIKWRKEKKPCSIQVVEMSDWMKLYYKYCSTNPHQTRLDQVLFLGDQENIHHKSAF